LKLLAEALFEKETMDDIEIRELLDLPKSKNQDDVEEAS
jgi:hypothetical protein